MYFLTCLPWDGELRENFPIATPGINEEIMFHPTAAPDADNQMETQHMVLGLYVGALTMATHHRGTFHQITVVNRMYNRLIGYIYLWPRGDATDTSKSSGLNHTVVSLEGGAKPINITTLAPQNLDEDKGILADPRDLHFRIEYRMVGRSPTRDPRDILLAVLDFLSNAAPFEPGTPFRQLEGRDTRTDPSAVVSIRKLARSDPRAGLLTYRLVTRAVQLLVRLMKIMMDFRPVEFDLSYRGYKYGRGSIRRMATSLGNATHVAVTS
ncbi:MAG: hypothetical protein Q9195_003855 [Heterodermia aff. obscurata]